MQERCGSEANFQNNKRGLGGGDLVIFLKSLCFWPCLLVSGQTKADGNDFNRMKTDRQSLAAADALLDGEPGKPSR